MKCEIVAASVRVFGKAIHSLAKIGVELHIEDTHDGLEFKTVNFARSGFASILFKRPFFHVYENGLEPGDDDGGRIKCKVDMKACLSVFKSLSAIEKMVEKCSIEFQAYETKLVFKLLCRHGIHKTYELACIESGSLNAIYDKSKCTNIITAPFKLLNDTVTTFQVTQEEVTLNATADCASIKTYTDVEPDTINAFHTELRLEEDEFDEYQIGKDTDVTFCLKELRALLLFADVTEYPVQIQFSESGRPIVFTAESPDLYEANFVLATLADEVSSSYSSSRAGQSQPAIVHSSKLPLPENGSLVTIETEPSVDAVAVSSVGKIHHPQEQATEPQPMDWQDARHTEDIDSRPPPNKKFRSIFLPKMSQVQNEIYEVLASDTDDESTNGSQHPA